MLSLNAVCKSFHGQKILKDVTLEVQPGQIIGIAGPSGSGKSTLLRCIQKLEKVDAGHIECEHSTGFMFQDFQLFPHMTVLENLTYAPKLKNKTTDHTAQALQLLEQLAIAQKADVYPAQLSGGQKQRVALARSLMMSAKVLLCDEPTSGLDVATIQEVVTLLRSVQAMGITLVISSHDLDFLTQIADTVILLKNGEIKTRIDPKTTESPIQHLKAFYAELA